MTERTHWEEDCLEWRGKVLTGRQGHWCGDWDDLPIDETCPEWPCGCDFQQRCENEQQTIDDTIQGAIDHWFIQGGKAQFGELQGSPKNADELISAILSVVRRQRTEHPSVIAEIPMPGSPPAPNGATAKSLSSRTSRRAVDEETP